MEKRLGQRPEEKILALRGTLKTSVNLEEMNLPKPEMNFVTVTGVKLEETEMKEEL